jgi:hypothetical protein
MSVIHYLTIVLACAPVAFVIIYLALRYWIVPAVLLAIAMLVSIFVVVVRIFSGVWLIGVAL